MANPSSSSAPRPRRRVPVVVALVGYLLAAVFAGALAAVVVSDLAADDRRTSVIDHLACSARLEADFFGAVTEVYDADRANPTAVMQARAHLHTAGVNAAHLEQLCPIGAQAPPSSTGPPGSSSSS